MITIRRFYNLEEALDAATALDLLDFDYELHFAKEINLERNLVGNRISVERKVYEFRIIIS